VSHASEKVKLWRQQTKKRIVKAFGGSCGICGYSRCNDSLALHHINPEEKDFSLGAIRANACSWAKIVVELRKCILVCHNCHSEIHAGLSHVSKDITRFDESFAEYRKPKPKFSGVFCHCGQELTFEQKKYCSNVCYGLKNRKIDWDAFDLSALYAKYPVTQIADILGVSDQAVHKRLKKLGLK